MHQNQSQKQVLSPQIRQYLKLLQMPLVELSQTIEEEVSENPLLEENISSTPEDRLGEIQKPEAPERENPAAELRLGDSFDHVKTVDDNLDEGFSNRSVSSDNPSEIQHRRDYQESLITKPEGLSDFLLWQIRFLNLDPLEKKIAEEIIGNINEDGYLRASIDEIAQACQTDAAQTEKILTRIQQFDPPGIGSRNLQEALTIQLKKKGPDAALTLEIVSHHLLLLEKRDWPQLAKILAVDIAKVHQAVEIISHLEPKPGRTFYLEEPISVVPDAAVSFDEEDNDKLKVEVHDESIPSLRINPYYRRLLRDKSTDEKTKVFLREKMLRAVVFLRALELRKSTLREVTEEITKAQEPFFKNGFAQLHPLRLKDIAQSIGIHESTVSRAIQGKYISTPQGTIPYKSFFSSKLETVNGEAESQKSIMEKIRKLISSEDPRHPLSDQDMLKIIQGEGIVIARRTVAKYRELLKILPSHLRRQR